MGRSKAADLTYKLPFIGFVIIGASASMRAVFAFSDAVKQALVFPNMPGLLFLFPKVREELSEYPDAIKALKTQTPR